MTHRRPSAVPGLFWILAGGSALAVVYWAQYVAGMAPCELCLWERWPYRILAALGALWLLSALLRIEAGRIFRPVIILVLLGAIGIATLHVGVEQGWWQSPLPECAAPRFTGGSFAERLAAMPARPSKPCDSPNRLFTWLPISMTTLDVIYAAILLVVSLSMPVPRRRRF